MRTDSRECAAWIRALARPDDKRPDWRKVWRTLDACFDLGPRKATWPGRFEDLFKTKRNTIVHFKELSRPLAPHPLGITTSAEYREYSLEEECACVPVPSSMQRGMSP